MLSIEAIDTSVLISWIVLGAAFIFCIVNLTRSFSKFLLLEPEDDEDIRFHHVPPRSVESFENSNCPICLGPLILSLQTNCGHRFCGECLYRFFYIYINRWRLGYYGMNPIVCPMCRCKVHLLFPCYSDEESKLNDDTELAATRNRITGFIRKYNKLRL